MNIPTVQITGEPDTHPEHGSNVIDARQLAERQIDVSKIPVDAHHIEVFDLMAAKDRHRYEKLYPALMRQAKAGTILVLANTREVLTRKDGSTGWFRYLEWSEYDLTGILGAKKE